MKLKNLSGTHKIMITFHLAKTVFVIAMMAPVTTSTSTRMSNTDIYAVANFSDTNSDGFNHLTVHNATGDVYIGGVNQLYRLNENLELLVNITTGPEYDEEDTAHDTFNKILTFDYVGNDLITCGAFRGVCQIRHVEDLSVTYSGEAIFVAANTSDETTIGYVAPHHGVGQQLLYVGTTSTSQNPGNPFISGRRLEGNQVFEVIEDSNGNSRVDVSLSLTTTYSIRYVAGFSYNSYSYFVTIQQQSAESSSAYISKLVRVCQRADSNYFNSYTEVTLRCRHNSYSLAQAAYITRPARDLSQSLALDDGEEVLFITFAVGVNNPPIPTTESAICMYKMSVIERAFQDAVQGCMDGDGLPEYTASWMQGASCAGSLPYYRGIHECHALTYYRYANGVDDQHGYDVEHYIDTLVTSIAVTTVQQHTVGFLGTDTGTILKVHFINNTYADTFEEIEFKGSTKPALQDMLFDRNKEYFYIFTDAIVRKLKVEQCSQYITCSDCVKSRDPYCGWCAVDRRCSTYARCIESDPSPYWPNVFDNVTCTIIKSIEPDDGTPIDITSKITLHVVGLPDIGDGESYSCAFDGYVTTAVNDGQTLTCDTPPIDDRPTIPLGEDHTTVLLQVISDVTVSGNEDFHYYDCSRHVSCLQCVTSNWACNWCVYENRCVHYLATCLTDDTSSIVVGSKNKFNNTDIKGQSFCPQLVEQLGKVLIPVNTDTEIQLSTMNIYHNKDIGGYECVLIIENTVLRIGATRRDANLVTCNTSKYTYQSTQQDLPVNLTLQWNNGTNIVEDVHGYTVTLYKCYVGRNNCRECLLNSTTTNAMNCGWCECSNTCEYVEHCKSDCFETDEAKCLSDGSFSCSRCVTSNVAGNWCVYENRCVHYLASCQTDDTSSIMHNFNESYIKGQSFCPQLAEQSGKVLIPVDIKTEIQLSTMNIYQNKDLGGYECVMTIENTLISIGATRHDENLVTCNSRKYSYQSTQQELTVNLTLQWNNGKNIIEDVHGYTVTLYKCYVGRNNCRECLSKSTTTNALSCGWCACSNTCEYVEHCDSDCFETDEAKCPSDGSTRCSQCVTSYRGGNWCVYENRCVDDLASCPTDDTSSIVVGSNNTFNNTDIKGRSFCPQLAKQAGKVLIPVDIDTEIELSTMNIYHNKDLEGYECAMTIENTLITIGATRHDANLVTCNARKYTYQSTRQELNVNLTLRWNNGETIIEDVHGYTVTLYKCNAGRHNCRECLSNSTTTSVLNCGWNECINICEYVKPCASYCFETDEAKCPSDGSTRTCAFIWSAFVMWYFIINTIQK